MPDHRTATSAVVSGNATLERHEALLLEQMTAPLPPCPDCGLDGSYITSWTPYRTVHRICCPVCFHTFWAAP